MLTEKLDDSREYLLIFSRRQVFCHNSRQNHQIVNEFYNAAGLDQRINAIRMQSLQPLLFLPTRLFLQTQAYCSEPLGSPILYGRY